MSTVDLAVWAKQAIESQEWGPSDDGDDRRQERRIFLGTVFALDPCGRYHHMLSPNGYTAKCGRFWESLERQLEKRGMWLESGEGDPCDQYAGQSRDIEDLPFEGKPDSCQGCGMVEPMGRHYADCTLLTEDDEVVAR